MEDKIMENTKFFASDDAVVTLKTEADKEKVLEFIAKMNGIHHIFGSVLQKRLQMHRFSLNSTRSSSKQSCQMV